MKKYTREEATQMAEWYAAKIRSRLESLLAVREDAVKRGQEWAVNTADRMIAREMAIIELEQAKEREWKEREAKIEAVVVEWQKVVEQHKGTT